MKKGFLSTNVLSTIAILSLSACSTDVAFEDIPTTSLGVETENSTPAKDSDQNGNNNENPPPDNSKVVVNESFVQGAISKPVDILFIVDNSTSMAEEQAKMGRRIGSFLGKLKGVDWKIGVTTTDVSNGAFGLQGDLIPIDNSGLTHLNPHMSDVKNKFINTVKRKETNECFNPCPSSDEQPLKASIMAMSKHNTTNSGFFRPGANLALVILSDEDEMSVGPVDATKPIEVINAFDQIFGGNKLLQAYGIIIQPDDHRCRERNPGASFGQHVASLANMTGGVTGSICSENYGTTLGEIGQSVLELVKTISLKDNPKPDSIDVKLTPEQDNVKWEIRGHSIYFTVPPKIGTNIQVSYLKN